MNWRDVLTIRISGWGLDVHVGVLLVAAVALALLIAALLTRGDRTWRITRANFSFAGYGQIDICPDNEVARIAHQAWVELSTRKAAIPVEPDNDVIVEIYNSWYELFRALRELARNVPAECLRCSRDAATLVDVLMSALNTGLRPHLTEWQARFRRWYDVELKNPECDGLSPQEIQKRFPQYEELMADLLRVNAGMIGFAAELKRVAHTRRRGLSRRGLFGRRTDSVSVSESD